MKKELYISFSSCVFCSVSPFLRTGRPCGCPLITSINVTKIKVKWYIANGVDTAAAHRRTNVWTHYGWAANEKPYQLKMVDFIRFEMNNCVYLFTTNTFTTFGFGLTPQLTELSSIYSSQCKCHQNKKKEKKTKNETILRQWHDVCAYGFDKPPKLLINNKTDERR